MTILDKIAANRRKEIERWKSEKPLDSFVGELADLPRSRFKEALEVADRVNIIAEIKKGSPSRGMMRPDLDPAEQARLYADGGAAAISVLTEEKHFFGSFDFLERARIAGGLPVLCKDFVVDRYQLFYARWRQADAILLIAALHTPDELARYLRLATEIGLDCLVEVHDEAELKTAVEAGAEMIGVNNRNLHDFSVSLGTSERLAQQMPDHVIRVAESGLNSATDIARLRQSGFNCFLIGEALVTATDPAEKLRELRQA